MSQLITPVITLSSIENRSRDYFSHRHNISTDSTIVAKEDIEHPICLDNVPSIINSKKPRMQLEPLSMQFLQQNARSESLLLSPQSILQKASHSSFTNTKHIVLPDTDRRPSVVTFSCDKESSIFYDTVSAFEEDEQDKLWRKRPSIIDKHSFRSWKKRRPSIQSRISSVYTQHTTNISIIHHRIDPQHLQQGIVLCATVSAKQKQFDSQPKYNHQQEFRKRALKWTEYRAVMTCTGYLELYHLCHCTHENSLLHIGLHQHNLFYKKPCHVIDLHSSPDHQKKKALFSRHSLTNNTFSLSLMSPVDFSWSLSSANTVFYFQTASVRQSQQWYQALYACLPIGCKKLTPKAVDLNIPQLNMCIRLPLAELVQVGDENVNLRRVRDSALALLHRHGNRPVDWNKRTVGLCWRYKEQLDWVIKPVTAADEEQEVAYLVESRLIEKTHELELRYWNNPDQDMQSVKEQDMIEGPLIDIYNKKGSTIYYGVTKDHYLFLYESHALTEEEEDQQLLCFKFLLSKKRYQTFPSDVSPSSIVGVIDILQVKHISYEKDILQLDDGCAFQTMHHSSHAWSSRLEAIQKRYQAQVHDESEIKQSGILYMKVGHYSTFEQRLCILTKQGDLYIFKSAKNKAKKAFDVHLSLTQGVYIYSGQECCSHIAGLPAQLPSRLFDSGMIVKDKPNQCCFVVRCKSEQYIFLTRTQDHKESWIQSIISIVQ